MNSVFLHFVSFLCLFVPNISFESFSTFYQVVIDISF